MYRGLQTKQRCKWSANYQVASRSTPFKYRGKIALNSFHFKMYKFFQGKQK